MPVKKINREHLKSLPVSPASRTKQIVWDRDIKGFGAYKTNNGAVSFLYQYRMPNGRAQSMKLRNFGELTLESARAMASDMAH